MLNKVIEAFRQNVTFSVIVVAVVVAAFTCATPQIKKKLIQIGVSRLLVAIVSSVWVFLGVIVSLVGVAVLDSIIGSGSTASPAVSVSPGAESTPIPAVVVTSAPAPDTSGPFTIYGKALYDSMYNGVDYSLSDKLSIIGDAYYDRKENDVYKPGYSSRRNTSNSTGYTLGLYYGDGYLFFVEVISDTTIVKLYYWGSALIACRDYRNGGELCYAGDAVFDSVAVEFAGVYGIGMG